MAISTDTALAIFQRALSEEIGISIRTDDAKAFRQELWIIRSEIDDPELERLISFVVATDTVFVVKKDIGL